MGYRGGKSILAFLIILNLAFVGLKAQSNEDCMMCHEDEGLTMERNGKDVSLFLNKSTFSKSVHAEMECIGCHTDADDADFKHAEQLAKLKKVDCGTCHDDFTEQMKSDIHHKLNVGDMAPDCKTCHGDHAVKSPVKVINKFKNYCAQCHTNDVYGGAYHVNPELNNSCLECHDSKDYNKDLSHSVHDGLSCTNCHSYVASHMDEHPENTELARMASCNVCHGAIAKEHKESIHGISLSKGIHEAAQCWSCHGGHDVQPAKSDSSRVHPKNLPMTCGKCHDDPEFHKKFFSTVKNPGKMYTQSVHGKLVEEGRMDAASCVTCHGVHDIKNRVQDNSKISAINIPNTCAECHSEIVEEYKNSIHWIAVQKGVREAPTCNDCHSEHSIHSINTIDKREEVKKLQENTCLQCHNNLILSRRYGLNENNASDYQDSYHGLAAMRGDQDAAMCIDCHGVHSILPKYHEGSTINPDNVLNTCKKCHSNATPVFSRSYSHTQDPDSKASIIQNLIRNIYFWMIIIVIGGMFLHNLMIYIYDVRAKLKKSRAEIRVPRFNKNEVVQHFILIISFTLLAITGFQLKFPDSWWAQGLNLFVDETVRQNAHRASAVVLMILSIYHVIYLIVTSRGRDVLMSILPKLNDIPLAVQNVMYYLGLRKKHPEFDNYNYIEKAEYWALIWGTLIMGATGFILWFPTVVGDWAPVWLIKVCEIVHFYEAILATLAIVIWHWFFVIYRPALRFTFIDGEMTLDFYKEEHKLKFKKIVADWYAYKNGKIEKEKLGHYTKMFVQTLEKQGVDPDYFFDKELENDMDLKSYIETNQ